MHIHVHVTITLYVIETYCHVSISIWPWDCVYRHVHNGVKPELMDKAYTLCIQGGIRSGSGHAQLASDHMLAATVAPPRTGGINNCIHVATAQFCRWHGKYIVTNIDSK